MSFFSSIFSKVSSKKEELISSNKPSELEQYFSKFRKNIIGINQTFNSPFGEKKIIYTDWTASGRLYGPIEEKLLNEFGPFVANTNCQQSHPYMIFPKANMLSSLSDVVLERSRPHETVVHNSDQQL